MDRKWKPVEIVDCPVCEGRGYADENCLPCARCQAKGKLLIIPDDWRTITQKDYNINIGEKDD